MPHTSPQPPNHHENIFPICCGFFDFDECAAHGADATKALEAADDARVAAIVKMDKAGLEAALDDLRYAHSTGAIDNKGYT